MQKYNLPKVLIVSRLVWDEKGRTSSTLSNMMANYDPDKLAMIYIETKNPYSKVCKRFFQIAEYSLIKKLYKWNTKTGRYIDNRNEFQDVTDTSNAKKETEIFSYVRGHRSMLYSIARELLWLLGGWKSKELKQFIKDFEPDVIWIDGSPLILMNRLSAYVLKTANVPGSIFMQDDIYTWKGCGNGMTNKMFRYFLRRAVRQVVAGCKNMFVASPKMKYEYDKIFNLNSTFITKGIVPQSLPIASKKVEQPIKMVYMGKMIYGRIYSLIRIAQQLKKINKDGIRIIMDVYSADPISKKEHDDLFVNGMVFQKPLVPYNEVNNIIQSHDVVVFVESFDPRFDTIARLSFSTKIVDYLTSGKCILAVGPDNLAPIQYLKEEDAAIVGGRIEEIPNAINKILSASTIEEYSKKCLDCGLRNHEKKIMDDKIFGVLCKISQND